MLFYQQVVAQVQRDSGDWKVALAEADCSLGSEKKSYDLFLLDSARIRKKLPAWQVGIYSSFKDYPNPNETCSLRDLQTEGELQLLTRASFLPSRICRKTQMHLLLPPRKQGLEHPNQSTSLARSIPLWSKCFLRILYLARQLRLEKYHLTTGEA